MKFTIDHLEYLIELARNGEHRDNDFIIRKLVSMLKMTVNANTRQKNIANTIHLKSLAEAALNQSRVENLMLTSPFHHQCS